MGKTAFIFPGQGAQYVGMGQDFYDTMPVCRQVMDKAGEITGLDIPKICFTENEEIHITEYTQIAMLSVEAAILKALEQEGLVPDVSAGLSLGEYGAASLRGCSLWRMPSLLCASAEFSCRRLFRQAAPCPQSWEQMRQ